MNRRELEQKAIEAADRCLKARGYISMVDVLMDMGKLSRSDHERWLVRQVPFLEKVISTNLSRVNAILRAVQRNSKNGKLKPSWRAYMSWGKGRRQPLRFSKTGDPKLERAYATHYILPKTDRRDGRASSPSTSGGDTSSVRSDMFMFIEATPLKP